MPPEMLAWLCEFCYIDLPCALVRRLARGPFPLSEACDAFLQTPPCEELSAFAQQALRALRETRLLVLHYVNRNADTGFVGYSFLAPDESVTLALRGSESGPCAPSLVDWADNFAAPFAGSVQYQDIYRLVNRYPAGPLTITGHSKGGHNALYALAVARNPQARAVAFNGQGFRRDQLDRAQIGGEMAAVFADRGEDQFANLRGDGGQLLRRKAAKLFRRMDFFQIHGSLPPMRFPDSAINDIM